VSGLDWSVIPGSSCWRQGDVVAKHFRAQADCPAGGTAQQMFRREAECLLALQSSRFTPDVLGVNWEQMVVYMEWCGPVLAERIDLLPAGWQGQLAVLSGELQCAKVRYGDAKLENLCVRDGRLQLIDFGRAYIFGTHEPTAWVQEHARGDMDLMVAAVERALVAA